MANVRFGFPAAKTLEIAPPLRSSPSNGATITLVRPTVTMMLASDRNGSSYEPGNLNRHTFVFDLVDMAAAGAAAGMKLSLGIEGIVEGGHLGLPSGRSGELRDKCRVRAQGFAISADERANSVPDGDAGDATLTQAKTVNKNGESGLRLFVDYEIW